MNNNQVVTFLLERTKIYVDYRIIEVRSGDQLIFMRFENPSEGIWKIRVYPEETFGSTYDLWLPIRQFLTASTQFTRPDPDVTITGPSDTTGPITVGGYDHTNGSIYINSGRGFTRNGRVKQEVVAPAETGRAHV